MRYDCFVARCDRYFVMVGVVDSVAVWPSIKRAHKQRPNENYHRCCCCCSIWSIQAAKSSGQKSVAWENVGQFLTSSKHRVRKKATRCNTRIMYRGFSLVGFSYGLENSGAQGGRQLNILFGCIASMHRKNQAKKPKLWIWKKHCGNTLFVRCSE